VRHRALLVVLLAVLGAACTTPEGPRSGAPGARPTLALVGGRVLTAPEAPAIDDGVVLVRGTTIAAVGARGAVAIPAGARVLDCAGATVSAGFWNTHVHFIGPVWDGAGSAPAERLADGLRSMLTTYGFVRVVDTGSWTANTLALRRRIDSGELAGPAILTAGSGLAPAGGSPYYILPLRLPELTSRAGAEAAVAAALEDGADHVKLFTGSWADPRTIVVMPVEIVRAAVETAHGRGRLVLAHPSDSAGARAAVEGGVDVLVHTFPTELKGPWDRTLPRRMHERRMGMAPTLKLFAYELGRQGLPPPVIERVLATAEEQVRAFAELGGQVLFGTDVGYMTDYDPTDEYVFLQRAGLSAAQILAALTTAPAARFGVAGQTGRLEVRLDADVTVVEGDPARDIRALARVRYALRAGRPIFERSR
jgi:imidazolonepropionase-like amidohydrolase